jgi:hypothetical protein
MSYVYIDQRDNLFIEHGVTTLLKLYDNVHRLLAVAGAVRTPEAIRWVGGATYTIRAALNFLVETGALREITNSIVPDDRIFIKGSI